MEIKVTKYESEEQLRNVREELTDTHRLQPVVSSVAIYLKKVIDVDINVYSIEGENGKYWICVRTFPKKRSYIYSGWTGTFVANEFSNGFRQIVESGKEFDEMKEENFLLTYGEGDANEEVYKVLEEFGFYSALYTPCYLFVKDHGNEAPQITVPNGYSLDSIHTKDVPIVTKSWKHAASDEPPFLQMRINSLPSVCIRDSNGDAAAFALCDQLGMILNLFVLPEHRGKRLGMIVMDQLAYLIKKEVGVNAHYCVVTTNDVMLGITNRREQVFHEDGSPVVIKFRETKYMGKEGERTKRSQVVG